jgi:mannan endo-1,4-beta-mannosidase
VTVRDTYYQTIFQYARDHRLSVNFWAYGGEGRPRMPNANWTQGDDFIGDPPHEPQGWYSVYDTDSSTLKIIKQYATMNSAAFTPKSFYFLYSLLLFSYLI